MGQKNGQFTERKSNMAKFHNEKIKGERIYRTGDGGNIPRPQKDEKEKLNAALDRLGCRKVMTWIGNRKKKT